MISTWQSQDAKSRFGELIDKTLSDGPQTITRRGVPVVKVVPVAERRTKKVYKEDLVTFFANSPLAGSNLVITRSRDTGRAVEL